MTPPTRCRLTTRLLNGKCPTHIIGLYEFAGSNPVLGMELRRRVNQLLQSEGTLYTIQPATQSSPPGRRGHDPALRKHKALALTRYYAGERLLPRETIPYRNNDTGLFGKSAIPDVPGTRESIAYERILMEKHRKIAGPPAEIHRKGVYSHGQAHRSVYLQGGR